MDEYIFRFNLLCNYNYWNNLWGRIFYYQLDTCLYCSFLFFIKDIIIYSHERQYKKNTPYEKYKIKKGIFVRALTGLLAGLHYFFFIGSYSHRKYNTQVYNPRTLECFFGNISVFLILIVYVFIGIGLFKVMSYYFLILMIIPIITNIISIEINKINKKRKNGKKS